MYIKENRRMQQNNVLKHFPFIPIRDSGMADTDRRAKVLRCLLSVYLYIFGYFQVHKKG